MRFYQKSHSQTLNENSRSLGDDDKGKVDKVCKSASGKYSTVYVQTPPSGNTSLLVKHFNGLQ